MIQAALSRPGSAGNILVHPPNSIPMVPVPPSLGWVEIEGPPVLAERLRGALNDALGGRRTFYRVRIENIGRCGEVLIGISSLRGRLPLVFGTEELEPGYVASVVARTMARFGL
jgi:hypothetical protein